MTKSPRPQIFTATLAALDLPDAAEVPEWVHLLPLGDVKTFDGRGPYRVTDGAAIIAASFSVDPRDQQGLIVDENHSSMLAAPKGGPSPARGKITAMEMRSDGIWGQIAWNAAGRALMADQSYRGISPVIIHDAKGQVLRIKNAALVNYPNLRELTALNQETPMNWANVAKALGLAETASEDDILAAINAMKSEEAGEPPALQAALTEIGVALGVSDTDHTAIVAAAKAVGPSKAGIVALQAELTKVAGELQTLKSAGAKDKATTFVDAEIGKGRVGVKPLREHYIAMHMQDADRVEKEINALPILGISGQIAAQPPAAGGEITSLNAEQKQVADLLGIPHATFLVTLQAEAKTEVN